VTDLGSELARLIERIVDRRLDERLGVARGVEIFTSKNLPPRTTRRAFVEACCAGRIEGAVKRGRIWECSAASWYQSRSTRPLPRVQLRLVQGEPDVEALADLAIQKIRGVKR
jgi:hypothetical protein